MNAILNILKPAGMTSHDVVAFTRKKLPGIKIGHTGTLDPAAAGVLPVCLGKATRISSYLLRGKKAYRGEITLGITTDTLDGEGEIHSIHTVPELYIDAIKNILSNYIGEINQTPPAYSAVHYQGKKLYKWAHEGSTIDSPSRKINIFQLKLVEYFKSKFSRLILDIECSHGTYIRTLAQQIGEEIGSGAHLSFLVRTKVENFNLEESVTLEKLDNAVAKQNIDKLLYPMDYALQELDWVKIVNEAIPYLASGNYLFKSQVVCDKKYTADEKLWRIYDHKNNFWGIGQWEITSQGLMFKPQKILR